jgi:hypothetical protein
VGTALAAGGACASAAAVRGPRCPTASHPIPRTQQDNNKGPILEVLRRHLAGLPPAPRVLEVASGTGQHAAHFAASMPALTWQPSDAGPDLFPSIAAHTCGLGNVLPPRVLDATWPPERWAAALGGGDAGGTPAAAAGAESGRGGAAAAAGGSGSSGGGGGAGPRYDLVYVANMTHIAPWAATQGLAAGAGALLAPGGLLAVYGPFKLAGAFTTDSNRAFHERLVARWVWWHWGCGHAGGRALRGAAVQGGRAPLPPLPYPAPTPTPTPPPHPPTPASNPEWGYRDTDAIEALGRAHGLGLVAVEAMPANNFMIVMRKGGAS